MKKSNLATYAVEEDDAIYDRLEGLSIASQGETDNAKGYLLIKRSAVDGAMFEEFRHSDYEPPRSDLEDVFVAAEAIDAKYILVEKI